jgi:hypothetical protein
MALRGPGAGGVVGIKAKSRTTAVASDARAMRQVAAALGESWNRASDKVPGRRQLSALSHQRDVILSGLTADC